MVTERHHSPEHRALWVISQIGTEVVRQAALGDSGLTDLLALTRKERSKVNRALLFHSFSSFLSFSPLPCSFEGQSCLDGRQKLRK